MAGLYDLIQKQDPYGAIDLIDPAAERRNKLAELMLTQSQSNPSWSNPLLALVGALQYGQGNNDTINAIRGRRTEFLKGLQAITKNSATPDEKFDALMNLKAEHGTDYGFGLDEALKRYTEQAKRQGMIQIYGYDNEGNLIPKSVIPKESKIEKPPMSAGTSTRKDALDTAQGVINGIIPPDPNSSSFRDRTAVNAELARQGYNLTTANIDWKAANKFYSSMNSTQQVRLRQAINSVNGALDNLEQLNQEYKRSGVTPLNKMQLIANSKNFSTTKQGELATKYLTQLAVVQDELSQVFMGGNSPTERFLEQAQNILRGDYSMKQLEGVIGTLRQNLKYRLNSINQVQPYSPSNKTAEEPTAVNPPTSQQNNDYDAYLKAIGAK